MSFLKTIRESRTVSAVYILYWDSWDLSIEKQGK